MRFKCIQRGLITLLIVMGGCQEQLDEEQRFARVGRTVLSREDYQAFQKMKTMQPTPVNEQFSKTRPVHTLMVETEALYRKARGQSNIESSMSWEWKKRFYPAQMYLVEILDKNRGITNDRIEKFYKANKKSFADTIKVPVKVDSPDSVAAAEDTVKDTLIYKPLIEVRSTVVDTLFLRKYPPDSAFWVSSVDSGDTVVDTAGIRRQWINNVRRDPAGFFMRKYYEESYGEPLPDSLGEWVGSGKAITPEDLELIRSWLPENQRARYDNPQGKEFLARWLLKWKLFSEKAKETGFAKQDEVKAVVEWAKKFEVVSDYLTQETASAEQTEITVDPSMVKFACWDRGGTPGVEPDSAMMRNMMEQYAKDMRRIALEEIVYEARQDAGVEYLQSEWTDKKSMGPEQLAAEADSLAAAGESNKALELYRELSEYFPFTKVGREALTELAKLQTEMGRYQQALRNYRRYLVFAADTPEERCNTFFMVGFIYDEYLDEASLAEVQYKWILKNAPECELADDAEFMVLHLDEPMTSVEDLRAEARRQGRDIEEDELGDPEETADVSELEG
ncbi:MAG: hypothetical protein GF344_06860 [Chitinivibrionales bacterium]|nr:hypothetical protein [Chitinivibrionales bacterium]